MRTKSAPLTPRKTERQVVQEKLDHLNNFLSKMDMDKFYETIGKQRPTDSK
jgi:hypothetical protein